MIVLTLIVFLSSAENPLPRGVRSPASSFPNQRPSQGLTALAPPEREIVTLRPSSRGAEARLAHSNLRIISCIRRGPQQAIPHLLPQNTASSV